jgi:hypothetical protein
MKAFKGGGGGIHCAETCFACTRNLSQETMPRVTDKLKLSAANRNSLAELHLSAQRHAANMSQDH